MQWENYAGDGGSAPLFTAEPLTFNSRQERLHRLQAGDRLWLVARCPQDRQYYFVAVLRVGGLRHNPPGSPEEQAFGEYAVVADRAQSVDLGKRFPADGLLRALQFDPAKPIKHGASIGQSLQSLRLLDAADERILDAALRRVASGKGSPLDGPLGLWTKCGRVFADYFLTNWTERREPLAFLLYDPPPALHAGAPVFIHSEKLRMVARFCEGQFVAGYKLTVDAEERLAERERVWATYRAATLDPPAKADFDAFWDAENGIRGLFLMEDVAALPRPVPWGVYSKALEWGYPKSVGYRYLSLAQSALLLRGANLGEDATSFYLTALMVLAR
jgi:hypothetical protein